MAQNCVVRDIDLSVDQFCSLIDLLPRKTKRLRIGEIERRGKNNAEIVAEFVLRERHAVAIGDLSARGRNVQNKGSREFLSLECRDDCFLFRRRTRAWCRCLRKRANRQEKQNDPQITQIFAE